MKKIILKILSVKKNVTKKLCIKLIYNTTFHNGEHFMPEWQTRGLGQSRLSQFSRYTMSCLKSLSAFLRYHRLLMGSLHDGTTKLWIKKKQSVKLMVLPYFDMVKYRVQQKSEKIKTILLSIKAHTPT